jgi:hypothetical protein
MYDKIAVLPSVVRNDGVTESPAFILIRLCDLLCAHYASARNGRALFSSFLKLSRRLYKINKAPGLSPEAFAVVSGCEYQAI